MTVLDQVDTIVRKKQKKRKQPTITWLDDDGNVCDWAGFIDVFVDGLRVRSKAPLSCDQRQVARELCEEFFTAERRDLINVAVRNAFTIIKDFSSASFAKRLGALVDDAN